MRGKIRELIIQKKPDIILSVFALSGRIVMDALDGMNLPGRIPVIVVVVDLFTIHFAWAEPRANLVIAPTEEAKDQLVEYGVPSDRLLVSELPINPRFSEEINPVDFRKEIDLRDDLFTVMIMGGGDGAGGIDRTVKILKKARLDVQVIAVAGRNKRLQNRLNRLKDKSDLPIRVFGFTDKIPELMSISDVLITKAGPMTLTEAISKELPVIIVGWVPGQEEGNVQYVKSSNLGYVVRKKSEIVGILRRLIDGGSELDTIKANIRERRRVLGAQKIANIVMSDSFQS